MLKVIKNRWKQGYRTTKYPKEEINLYSRFRGLPTVHQDCDKKLVRECAEACPKDVNPIEKITKLHNMQFEQKVAQSNVATRHAEGFVRSIKKHGFLDEADIVLYSEGPFGMHKHVKTAVKMLKAGKIHFTDALPFVDNVPKSKNLDEIKKLIEISQTNKLPKL